MLSAVIDRFEEDKAVLLIGEEEQKVIFPRNLLSSSLKEGDYLTIDINYDEKATLQAKEEIDLLFNSLNQDNL